jgi:hypothetical protein
VYNEGEERMKNVTYLFLKSPTEKIDNIVVYKSVSMTLNEELLYAS